MIVGTTEAAKILNITSARLRFLLIRGRVEGAYKTGKMWLIPLFKGKPIISQGTRGPKPRWRNPRKPAKTVIHVSLGALPRAPYVGAGSHRNSHRIKDNQKSQQKQPVITVKKGNTNQYGYEVEIPGGCRVVYSPDNPKCGARVWIESLHDVRIIS